MANLTPKKLVPVDVTVTIPLNVVIIIAEDLKEFTRKEITKEDIQESAKIILEEIMSNWKDWGDINIGR